MTIAQTLFRNVFDAASLINATSRLKPEVLEALQAINPASYKSTAEGFRALVDVTKGMPGDYVLLHVAAMQAAAAYEKEAKAEPPEDITVKQKRIIDIVNKAGADVRALIDGIPITFSNTDPIVFAGNLRKLAEQAGKAGVSLRALKAVLEDAATFLETE